MRLTPLLSAILLVATANLVGGCRCDRPHAETDAPAPSASGSATPVGIPLDAGTVAEAVNPEGKPPYTGPFGSVKGTVTVSGDPAPPLEKRDSIDPGRCPESSREFYAKLFREGPGRTLADAMVTVTGYEGKYVPAEGDAVNIEIRDCTFGTRTVAMTYGQRLDVLNKGRQAHTPHLVGGPMKALMIAMPGGDPVSLYPTRVGHLGLTDQMNPRMFADVLVVKFPTHDVTGLDGRFEIGRVPVGEVSVHALMPATVQHAARKVTIREGQTTEVDLTIHFDAEQHTPKPPKPPGSAAPAAPVVH